MDKPGEKQADKPQAPLAPPAAPPATPKTAEVATDAASGLINGAPAEAAKPPEALGPQALPDGKNWQEAFDQVKKTLHEEGVADSPLAAGFLAIAAMMLKYSSYLDFLPGHFDEKVRERTDTFTDDEKKILKDAKQRKEVSDEDKRKFVELGKNGGLERATTKYAVKTLWGFDNIEDSVSLIAKLKNTKMDDGSDIYEETHLEKIKKDGAILGTVLVFSTTQTEGQKIVAIATGDKDEFEFFDPNKNTIIRFNISDPDSPIKFGFVKVLKPKSLEKK